MVSTMALLSRPPGRVVTVSVLEGFCVNSPSRVAGVVGSLSMSMAEAGKYLDLLPSISCFKLLKEQEVVD